MINLGLMELINVLKKILSLSFKVIVGSVSKEQKIFLKNSLKGEVHLIIFNNFWVEKLLILHHNLEVLYSINLQILVQILFKRIIRREIRIKKRKIRIKKEILLLNFQVLEEISLPANLVKNFKISVLLGQVHKLLAQIQEEMAAQNQ